MLSVFGRNPLIEASSDGGNKQPVELSLLTLDPYPGSTPIAAAAAGRIPFAIV
jgi:hypothetical protein